MKPLLVLVVVAPIVDFFANDGRFIAIVIAQIVRAGHVLADFGASFMPGMT